MTMFNNRHANCSACDRNVYSQREFYFSIFIIKISKINVEVYFKHSYTNKFLIWAPE